MQRWDGCTDPNLLHGGGHHADPAHRSIVECYSEHEQETINERAGRRGEAAGAMGGASGPYKPGLVRLVDGCLLLLFSSQLIALF